MIDHILLKVKVMGDVDKDTLKEIIDGVYELHLDVYSVESEAVEQSVQSDEKAVAWLNKKTGAISIVSGSGYDTPLFRR